MIRAVTSPPSHQLDLFIDGRDAILVHEIVTRLVARDPERAAAGLARLRDDHPAHPDLPGLALLADSLRPQCPPPGTPAVVTARIETMESAVVPAARRLLGGEAAAFLRPLWKALAVATARMAFDDTYPRAHPGWLHQRDGDWAAVRAAVEAEPDWAARPRLRYWMGLARHHLWNWQAGGRPIAELDRIDWCDRQTTIVPDSDVWVRQDLVQPVFALGKELEGRGAKVNVLKLPSGPDAAKVR